MLTFPTQNLFIEGPDCAGKTTTIRKIHNLSNYRWHIHDRSQVSRKVFAELYERKNSNINSDFHFEISNLNNRFVFLLPPFETIEERFLKRGDDLHQDLTSIKNVYDAFSEECEGLFSFPNVIVCREENTDSISETISCSLTLTERCMIQEVSDQVLDFVRCKGGESYPLKFTLYDNGQFEESNSEILCHESEGDYYRRIFNSFHKKINNELEGKNEYSRIETHRSRRFVYSDPSCISFIHMAVRDKIMDFHSVIRSTDVKEIFPHDLKFLYYLASTCYDKFEKDCDKVRMRFNLNSAHIIN